MNSQDKQWWVAQAGEYVLGTLSDASWKTFQKAIQHEPDAQRLVAEWEQTFQPLADSLTPVKPENHVWIAILNRLSAADSNLTSDDTEPFDTNGSSPPIDDNIVRLDHQRSITKGYKNKAAWWRAYAGLATAASVLFASLAWFNYASLTLHSPQQTVVAVSQFDAISIIRDDQSMPLWVVDAALEKGLLRVTALAPPIIDTKKAYQLWLVKPDNAGVQSMGLIPRSSDESVLMPIVTESISPIAFAVSLEAAGGSTEPGPIGPVLYQGVVQKLKL